MLCFWVLSMSHIDCDVHSVFVKLSTLMRYWGHKLENHEGFRVAEIKQEFIAGIDSDLDSLDTLIEVQVFDNECQHYVRYYFKDVREVVKWQDFQDKVRLQDPDYKSFDWDNMTVKSLSINRD